MSVPPSSTPPSTPPSRGRDEEPRRSRKNRERDKDFRLPEKKEQSSKKNLFDLAAEGQGKLKQELSQEKIESLKGVEKTSGIEAKAQVSQIGKLIQQMVNSMRIGTVGGKEFASMSLSKDPSVPQAFAGSNLTLSFRENGLVIRFDNFTTPQQQEIALNMVEQNKEQLTQMIQALQAKNIQVAELNIGDRKVSLPRVEPLPPPFAAFEPEAPSPRREGGQQEGGRGGGEEEEPR